MSKFSVKGITLIELLVAVAVVAIIAAVAYPSFMDGLRKSRRAEAIKGLLTMQLTQEEHRITNPGYVTQASFAASTATGTTLLGSPSSSYYSFSVVPSTGPATYTLQAEASGAQRGDTDCIFMFINKADEKTPEECW